MSATPPARSWTRTPRPLEEPQLRLYCLPHAGAGTSAFANWWHRVPRGVEVRLVQLPGREVRLAEPALGEAETLVTAIAEAIALELDGPWAVFGHSMGALLAYELAHRFPDAPPAALLVSGHHAPHLRGRARHLHELDDAAFAAAVEACGGFAGAASEATALLELLLPTLRADFRLCERYVHPPRPPLRCPLVAFTGDRDPAVDATQMAAWRELTAGAFELNVFAGGHFYLYADEEAFFAVLRRTLRPLLPVAPGAA